MFEKTKNAFIRVQNYFNGIDAGEERIGWKGTAALIIVAYAASVAARLIFIFAVQKYPEFHWNGQLIPTTHDAFYWGAIAQKALYRMHAANTLVPDLIDVQLALPAIAAFIVKFFHISLEAVMIYLPIFFSSLIVVPIVLIGRIYKKTIWGFCAALIACAAVSYYERTLAGYFDTDMFSLTLTVFIFYCLLGSFEQRKLKFVYGLISAIAVMPFLYDKMSPIAYAMILVYIACTVLWKRKDDFAWLSIIAFTAIFWLQGFTALLTQGRNYYSQLLALIVVVGVVYLFDKIKLSTKKTFVFALVSIVFFLSFSSPLQSIYSKSYQYLTRQVFESSNNLYFQPVIGTISEAQTVPFLDVARRVIGSQLGFFLAIAGYVFLVIRRPAFLIGLPLLGLGLFAMYGGLRFTIFAIPIAALSAVFLVFTVFQLLLQKNKWKEKSLIISLSVFAATMFIAFPNVQFIKKFFARPVLFASQIKTLKSMQTVGRPGDTVITWWDYGSGVWFYSGLKTISAPSDQGDGATQYLISKLLMSDKPRETANLCRWMAEKFKQFSENKKLEINSNAPFFSENSTEALNSKKFLADIATPIYPLPAKTSDVFVFLPIDILNIAYAINTFSNLDIATGVRGPDANYLIERNYKISGNKIFLPNQKLAADFNDLTLKNDSNGYALPVNAFHVVYYDKDGKLRSDDMVKNKNSDLHFIFLKSQGVVVILGNRQFNSALIQMLIFENYDKNLFEPVDLSPNAKVYKLKI